MSLLILVTDDRPLSPKSRRANVLKEVILQDFALAAQLKKTADKKAADKEAAAKKAADKGAADLEPDSDTLTNGGRIDFAMYDISNSFVFTAKPPENTPPEHVESIVNQKLMAAIQRRRNFTNRVKWAIQYPKRVKPTSNDGHLVLSTPTKREGEKLINATKRKHRPHKKQSWLKPSTK